MDNLTGGTVQRLSALKGRAAYLNETAIRHAVKRPALIWKDVRYLKCGHVETHGPTYSPIPSSGHKYANVPDAALDGLRYAGTAASIVQVPDAYLASECGTEYTAAVWQLPSRHGQQQFIAGYRDPETGYSVIAARGNNLRVYDTKQDAAFAADWLTRDAADAEYARSEADQALQLACEVKDDVKTKVSNIIRAIRSIRAAGGAADAERYLLDTLELCRDEWREKLQLWFDAADNYSEFE
jgi:hypothetical protein